MLIDTLQGEEPDDLSPNPKQRMSWGNLATVRASQDCF